MNNRRNQEPAIKRFEKARTRIGLAPVLTTVQYTLDGEVSSIKGYVEEANDKVLLSWSPKGWAFKEELRDSGFGKKYFSRRTKEYDLIILEDYAAVH